MAKVNSDEFGSSRPRLTVDDVEGDAVVLTLTSAETIVVDDPETASGKRSSLVLTFQESGDKSLWLNKTQVEYLVERLGDDTDEWLGQAIPLEKKRTQFGKKVYNKVYVCAPEAWDDLLDQAGVGAPRKARKTARPVKKAKRAK